MKKIVLVVAAIILIVLAYYYCKMSPFAVGVNEDTKQRNKLLEKRNSDTVIFNANDSVRFK